MNDANRYKDLYGYKEELVKAIKAGVDVKHTRTAYSYLIEDQLFKNNSIIPSRSERKVDGVKWSIAWTNWKELRGVSAEEKIFVWKVQQDMLLIGFVCTDQM